MTSRTRIILIFWALGILALSGAAYWFFFIQSFSLAIPSPSTNQHEVNTLPAEIIYGSSAYEEIRTYKALGETAKVKELFEGMQQLYAPGTAERAIVDYDYGFYMMFSTEEAEEGITMLKGLAADEAVNPLTRAFAMEALGRATLTFGNAPATTVIFSTEPYSTIRASASTTYLATIGIFKAAVEIQPTAIAALRIAQYHSYVLHSHGATLTEEEKQMRREEYQTYMNIADAQMRLIEGKVAFAQYLADFYVTKAYTLSLMYFAKEHVDQSQVEELYRKAIALAQGSEQVFGIFNYAAFLSRTETETPEAVDALVAQLEQVPLVRRKLFNAYVANALRNQTGAYEDILRLRAYSPAFESYVEQLNIDVAS